MLGDAAREGEGEREIEGERAASCWYSSAAAVPDEAAIFTHSAAFFSAGILSRRRASTHARLRISERTVRERTRARLLVPFRACKRGLVFNQLFCAFSCVVSC